MTWDPRQYSLFANERERPFFDLLNAVPAIAPRRIVDLGCGPGNLTKILSERWPDAEVVGIDSSAEMLAKATPGPRLSFRHLDLLDWTPETPIDLLFSNATLQWVSDHARVFPRLAKTIAPGGVLAVQMPGNHLAPSHRRIAELATSPAWTARLGDLGRKTSSVLPLTDYASLLLSLGLAVDAWETTYLHLLRGDNAVLEWIKGTHLRPFLDRLTDPEKLRFLGDAADLLLSAYPPIGSLTPFPFRRLFLVAQRNL